jgi:phosphoribosylformylglycinamidine cyclo-ligase
VAEGKYVTYEDSGVSIAAQDRAIAAFKDAVEGTHGPEVLAAVGSFCSAFKPGFAGLKEPVLVSSTDGVGTKVRLHVRFGTYDAAGRDLVAAVLNDVICSGAHPLFFLDCISGHTVVPEVLQGFVSGMAEACREAGCALVGGEIAELGDTYHRGEYDLVGFGVGLVDREEMLGPHRVQPGDVLIGLASTGVHCNGFSLVRRIFEHLSDDEWIAPRPDLGASLRDVLLAPARCYAAVMRKLQAACRLTAAAHISGGGLQDNVPRSLPAHLAARIDGESVPVPPVFAIIQRAGPVAEQEMWHVFNMGVGFVIALPPNEADTAVAVAREEGVGAHVIGEVVPAGDASRFEWSRGPGG